MARRIQGALLRELLDNYQKMKTHIIPIHVVSIL
jgi:hypothetical protein